MKKIALIGLGFIGSKILDALENELKDKFQLGGFYDVAVEKMEKVAKRFIHAKRMSSEKDFDHCDIVIEAANQEVVKNIFDKVIRLEKIFIPMSVGAFTSYDDLFEKFSKLSQEQKRKILFPSGAIGGFDAIDAMKLVGFDEVRLETHKPLRVFENDPYIKKHNITLQRKTCTLIFEGNAKEAAKNFPRSINVGARLALATLGPEKTIVKIFADPEATRNIHKIFISSSVGSYSFLFHNFPSPDNPRTSWLAALSVIAILNQL